MKENLYKDGVIHWSDGHEEKILFAEEFHAGYVEFRSESGFYVYVEYRYEPAATKGDDSVLYLPTRHSFFKFEPVCDLGDAYVDRWYDGNPNYKIVDIDHIDVWTKEPFNGFGKDLK